MEYKLIERANPQDRTKVKWYANPVNDGKISKREIAQDIVGNSSLSKGDVLSVIENLLDTMPKYLLMGKSVSLGEFGTLRLSFSSDGVDKPEDFNPSMISGVKVVFTPGTELKSSIQNISFEKGE
ncbi:MAG: DNA-binding protein [Bacteroidetes bacterium]|nr:DNA-binding protein [Bacteroidota bacterium]